MDVVKIVGAVFVFLLAIAVILRMRKLRRDEMRELAKPVERRLITPPPSPYRPSKGFRLLDGTNEPLARPEVERPRLDPSRPYVFGESSGPEEVVPAPLRHSQDWFLTRSSHRSGLSIWLRRIVVVVVVVVVIAIVATYYADHHKKPIPGKGTSAPALLTAASATTGPSVGFFPTAVTGGTRCLAVEHDCGAAVLGARDQARDQTWAAVATGSSRTLLWSGAFASATTMTLTASLGPSATPALR